MSLALSLALSTVLAAPASAVTWSIDHANRLVNVDARVTLWNPNGAPSPAQVVEIIEGFRRGWEGAPILCYRLHVRVHAGTGTKILDVPPDSIGLRLVDTPYSPLLGVPRQLHVFPYTRSYIAATGDEADYLGDAPAQAGVATPGPIYPTDPDEQSRVWIADPRPMTLSHEFGHILGLHDNYGPTGLRPGAVADAMFNNGVTGAGRYFPETITKVVRRGGVDLSQLQCSRHLEVTPIDMSLHAPFGYIGLDAIQLKADNCEWIPPSNDPVHVGDKNVWTGKLTYAPRMETADQAFGFTVHPVFAAAGPKVESVKFETLARRDDSNPAERWRAWETVTLFKDANIDLTAELRLRSESLPPAAENLRVHVRYGDAAGQWGYASNKPITVEARNQACAP